MADDVTLLGVRQRFDESREVLDRLSESLRELALTEEDHRGAAISLRGAADSLSSHAASLAKIAATVSDSMRSLDAAVNTARLQLDAGNPSAAVDAVGHLGEMHRATDQRVQAIEAQLASLMTENASRAAELAALQAKVQAIPEKVRRKYGLAPA